ncbi:MAG: tRNA (guanine37-N1)-methyltransferase [Rhodospirillaceae bacterium]|nr:MAG: tRNA (guanine37-N1)-methyltransferase [Rhodospirillaceae bacterium]
MRSEHPKPERPQRDVDFSGPSRHGHATGEHSVTVSHGMKPMVPFRVCVLTLFPAMFPGPLGHSLAGRAQAEGRWSLETVDIRVDDAPFGGGPGMVLRADVVDAALQATRRPEIPFVYLTPRGQVLTQARIRALSERNGLVVLCGRFEGVDQRVLERHGAEELSIGDYVLSGGEPAAMVLVDAIIRLLPGVVGHAESLREESFERGLLEYPHYTRPQVWAGQAVPEVLISGHHQRVAAWRQAASEAITRERRPDLWIRYQEGRV